VTEFDDKNKHQRKLRDKILIPGFYERYYGGHYRLLDDDRSMQDRGVDTIVEWPDRPPLWIEEKIVDWPLLDDKITPRESGYTAFTLETKSCTVPGFESKGWMVYCEAHYLLYCLANFAETLLECYLIDMPKLKEWFWSQNHERWYLWRSKEKNRTECRVVPILEIRNYVRMQPFELGPNMIAFRCRVCGNWAPYGIDHFPRRGMIGLHYCKEHRPRQVVAVDNLGARAR
jgi:hypothetical protein